jgi:hypothetical protein
VDEQREVDAVDVPPQERFHHQAWQERLVIDASILSVEWPASME